MGKTEAFAVAGAISLTDCADREPVVFQPSTGAFTPPLPAYDSQDLGAIATRLPRFRDQTGVAPQVPAVRLDLFTIRDGWFAVGNHLDGLVLTNDRHVLQQTAIFTGWSPQQPLKLPHSDVTFDEVFIGFDGGWTNWYHWLCFALGRSSLAASLLRRDACIVLPDYTARPSVGFGRAAWTQSLHAFGLTECVQFLPPGLYRARAIRLFWTEPREPTDLTYLDAFLDVFTRVRRTLRRRPDLPKRLLLSRAGSANTRLTIDETALLESVAARHGFTSLRLDDLDFLTQAEALFNADCVIGAHGAALTNILFGRAKLGVLELNLRLDGETLPRPWFYLLAQSRRQPYMMLDRDAGDLTRERLDEAIGRLMAFP